MHRARVREAVGLSELLSPQWSFLGRVWQALYGGEFASEIRIAFSDMWHATLLAGAVKSCVDYKGVGHVMNISFQEGICAPGSQIF